MTDYQPLIARAVNGLDSSTGEARRALYERARTALVTQLRAVEPALSESEITKERLALEEAIRRVEADAARKSRTETREPRPAAGPIRPSGLEAAAQMSSAAGMPPRRERTGSFSGELPAARRPEARRDGYASLQQASGDSQEAETIARAAPISARERLLSGRTSPVKHERMKGFNDVVSGVHDLGAATAKAAQSARNTRNSYGAPPDWPATEDEAPSFVSDGSESRIDHEEVGGANYAGHNAYQPRGLEPHYDLEDEQPMPMMPPSMRHPAHATAEEEYKAPRPPRSYRGAAKLVVALIILAGIGATASWQRTNIADFYHSFTHPGFEQPAQATHEAPPPAEPKFSGRVPQEQVAGQSAAGASAAAAAPSTSQAPPAVAQRVVLYEEDPKNPQGKRFVGSAMWRTETVSPGPGLAPELAVRADMEIPERHMTITWSLRRNTDKALPASHTIEIKFNLPPDFPGGAIANVPGILMKEAEQARGTPLAGLVVKVTNDYFLVGLSAVDADMQRNVKLLKDRPWFDIPIVYANGGRAILAMEKGPPGDRAFAEAFAAWSK